jgi:hypothetical protein
MTHAANGHHLRDLGGLRVLEPGDVLSGRLQLILDDHFRRAIPSQDERRSG